MPYVLAVSPGVGGVFAFEDGDGLPKASPADY
jgi:hypothetical protein